MLVAAGRRSFLPPRTEPPDPDPDEIRLGQPGAGMF